MDNPTKTFVEIFNYKVFVM